MHTLNEIISLDFTIFRHDRTKSVILSWNMKDYQLIISIKYKGYHYSNAFIFIMRKKLDEKKMQKYLLETKYRKYSKLLIKVVYIFRNVFVCSIINIA